jgi:hypothetical protein
MATPRDRDRTGRARTEVLLRKEVLAQFVPLDPRFAESAYVLA